MNRRAFCLEPLSLPDAGACELIEIAGATGFTFVSFVLHSPHPTLPADPIVADHQLRSAALEALRQKGLKVSNIECFNLTPDADPAGFEAGLACGHALGARTATAIVWENSNRSDVIAKLRRLCDMAQVFGIRVNLEFMALSRSLDSLRAAVELVRDCGRSNAGVMLDLLHLMRTAGSVADVRALDPALIGGAQICDGPLQISQTQMLAEAGGNRAPPGEGQFPVREFVDALPQDLIIGIEAPQIALVGTLAPRERASRLIDAARRIVAI